LISECDLRWCEWDSAATDAVVETPLTVPRMKILEEGVDDDVTLGLEFEFDGGSCICVSILFSCLRFFRLNLKKTR
jgi:hypothetical protein